MHIARIFQIKNGDNSTLRHKNFYVSDKKIQEFLLNDLKFVIFYMALEPNIIKCYIE